MEDGKLGRLSVCALLLQQLVSGQVAYREEDPSLGPTSLANPILDAEAEFPLSRVPPSTLSVSVGDSREEPSQTSGTLDSMFSGSSSSKSYSIGNTGSL